MCLCQSTRAVNRETGSAFGTGVQARLLSLVVVDSRMRETVFLDDAERERAWKALEEDRAVT